LEEVMTRLRSPARLAVAGLLLAFAATTAVQAQAINTDKNGLALYGYDPVAYQTDSSAIKGSEAFTATHEGATYRFATAANRDAFQANPDKYLPAYGGYCAYGVSRGYKVKIDPEAFRVVEGRLYLNYDKSVQSQWLKDIAGYIAKANANWLGLKDKPRS
jgi:YHS domain-containing protein